MWACVISVRKRVLREAPHNLRSEVLSPAVPLGKGGNGGELHNIYHGADAHERLQGANSDIARHRV
jgi:hypothetical protein